MLNKARVGGTISSLEGSSPRTSQQLLCLLTFISWLRNSLYPLLWPYFIHICVGVHLFHGPITLFWAQMSSLYVYIQALTLVSQDNPHHTTEGLVYLLKEQRLPG